MKNHRSHLAYRTLSGLALIVGTIFLTTGCVTAPPGGPPPDPERLAAIKEAFKGDVSAATAISANDPKVRLYLSAAGPAVCDLSKTKQFGPSQLEAALKGVTVNGLTIKQLNSPQVLLARAALLHFYTLAFGLYPRQDFKDDSFFAGLLEVLCDGITEGLPAPPTAASPPIAILPGQSQ